MDQRNTWTGYLGTYASSLSAGVYRFTLDRETGHLTAPELLLAAPDCKYLSLSGGVLAAPVQQGEGTAGLLLADLRDGGAVPLGTWAAEETTACHVVQDGEHIYTANYHQGLVLAYRRTAAGPVLEHRVAIAPEAGCHQILLHGRLLLVPCLLQDRIALFDRERGCAPAGEIPFAPGTGPRHGVFSRDHSTLFLVSELSNEVFRFRPEGEDWTLTARRKLDLPPSKDGAPPASAAIRLSPDERFLYVSTRFANVVTVLSVQDGALTPVQQVDCGGDHPRDIALTGDGRFLLTVNRWAGGLVCFPVDPATGRIGPERSRVPAPEAVSVVLGPGVPEKGTRS